MPISYKHKIYTTLGTPTELSGNGAFVTNSAGVPVKDYSVKGRTIVWNQLLDKSKYPATTTSSGVTFTNNGDGSITVSGTSTASNYSQYVAFGDDYVHLTVIANHKYFFSLHNYSTEPGFIWVIGGTSDPVFNYSETSGKGFITTSLGSKTGTCYMILRVNKGVSVNNKITRPQLFDLTEIFGAGNEPATPEEFRAMFPDDYYPYNAGELKTIVPTSIEASGIERFQLLDKSKYPATTTQNGVTFTNNGDGTITANGAATDRAAFVLYDRGEISVIRGKDLVIGDSEPGGAFINYNLYDSNGRWVQDNASYSGKGNIFTVNNNAALAQFYIAIEAGTTVSNLVFKPQLFDLTQMFGAGNEPATPAEFWQRVPDKLYGYDPNDYKSVNIPSSKYFPDGMRSAGSAYDEINFLSQKAIKRIGIRAYQTGDENNTAVMTDKKNTVYELATPVETAITPPLQALSTSKGFTSFSAPNSLMQNGPLSVTYYAEGGASPEKGWLTSYKRKLYMGRNIEWNQLFTNSVTSSNGVTISQNQDGTMTLNGTANKSYINFTNLSDAMNQIHKYLLCLKILNNLDNVSFYYGWLNRSLMRTDSILTGESCAICNQTESLTQLDKGNGLAGFTAGTVFNNVKIAVMVMDLTQMFGAGNEPATPEEFWTYFDHKLYPYNPGETQPLFKISRKSQWGGGNA